MSGPVSLLFGVHAHQPAGNFPEVVEDAHQRCYGPFLRTLHRHPGFRFAVHFSGWLLEQLLERHPADMALLREMVARGQVEVLGGGDMEPVLAAIPHRDRVAQLRALSDRLEAALGQRPEGAWLTERVWEATVVPALAEAGIGFVTVDDYHFLCAGRDPGELTGHFSTEEDGRRLDLFPISEALRYRIPFAPAREAVAALEAIGREGSESAAIYFDDIEKFGIWPDTHDWVYGRRWLEDFIEGVVASPHLRTAHFSEYRRQRPGRGLVYLPTTSYIEMGEWTLPAHRAARFAELLAQHRAEGTYEQYKPFLRGGIWRNFLSRYPEANWMHKRMLGLSARLAALPPAERTPGMTALLHRAQANDAYWHGLFGGLYLPHLRRAVWNALLALERELDRREPPPPVIAADLDLDGREELLLGNESVRLALRDDGHAAICELSSLPLTHNFGDTLARRVEHYHRLLARQEGHGADAGEGIASAHDRVAFRHAVTPADAEPDARPRGAFLDLALPAGGEGALVPAYRRTTGSAARFEAILPAVAVSKELRPLGHGVEVSWQLHCSAPLRWETRVDLAMPSCDGFLGRVRIGTTVTGGFGEPARPGALGRMSLEDGVLGGSVHLLMEPAAEVAHSPMHTVSQSEAGFEKIMQSLTLDLGWDLPAGHHRLRVLLSFTVEADGAPGGDTMAPPARTS